MRRAVVGEARLPVALQTCAARARVPALVHRVWNLERRIDPAKRLARELHLFLAQRLAVRELRAGAVGRALADDGLAADERRTIADAVRFADGGGDRLHVVPVDMGNDMPTIGGKTPGRVVGEPALGLAVDRDPVVIVEGDELG